jgi:hypothetical protein
MMQRSAIFRPGLVLALPQKLPPNPSKVRLVLPRDHMYYI